MGKYLKVRVHLFIIILHAMKNILRNRNTINQILLELNCHNQQRTYLHYIALKQLFRNDLILQVRSHRKRVSAPIEANV